MPRAGRSSVFLRRLTVGFVVFSAVVLLDLVLFGWLIFRSLSQREIEQALLETRQEAAGIAEQLADAARQGEDLYTVVTVETATRSSIESLHGRELVRSVEIHDSEGRLVLRSTGQLAVGDALDTPPYAAGPSTDLLIDDTREFPAEAAPQTVRVTDEYQVEELIGDYGMLIIGVDPEELEARVVELRSRLVRQTAIIAVLTLVLLATGYLFAWLLVRRNQRLEEQAAEAERLAYVGTLASGLAHEIRSPLNSLNLNMQMLEEEIAELGGDLPTGSRLLGITRREIGRLEALVTDFLSYARPRPLELEDVPAVDLLEEAGEVLVGEARMRRVGLAVEDRSGGARVAADRAQIRQLLLNLAQNALAATEQAARAPQIVLAAERRATGVDLVVEDNGCGMSPDDVERAFEIFYSTRRGGTGLGLAIVRRIAESHGGEVTIESTPGVGTTVRVALPALPTHETAPAEAPDEKNPRPFGRGLGTA